MHNVLTAIPSLNGDMTGKGFSLYEHVRLLVFDKIRNELTQYLYQKLYR